MIAIPEELCLNGQQTDPARESSGRSEQSARAPRAGYCFFAEVAGVTGCAPPVDFGPGVAPALFSERVAVE